MAERKPGPVKPPMIELTARPVDPAAANARPRRSTRAAGSGQSEPTTESPPTAPEEAATGTRKPAAQASTGSSSADTQPGDPPKPPPPFIAERPETVAGTGAQPWTAIAVAAIIGALLGTALTYTLATWVPLPAPPSALAVVDPTDTLADHDQRLSALEGNATAVASQATRTQVSLDATIAQLDSGLGGLRKALDDLNTRIPATADFPELEQRVRALSSRLDAVAAGASSADSQALGQTVADMQSGLADISARLKTLEQSRGSTDTALANLRSTLADVEQKLTPPAEPTPPPVNRPALAQALETAIFAGHPFAAELTAATTAVPELAAPAPLAARASTGLPDAEALAQRFSERVPDIFAARPSAPSASWQDSTLDWLKSMLAIRPSAEEQGDAPEAVLSRLEAAMERHDFAAAATLFDQLPPPMRTAAGGVADDVALWAEAQALLTTLRSAPTGAAQ